MYTILNTTSFSYTGMGMFVTKVGAAGTAVWYKGTMELKNAFSQLFCLIKIDDKRKKDCFVYDAVEFINTLLTAHNASLIPRYIKAMKYSKYAL